MKDGARRHRLELRLTDEEYELIFNVSKKIGKSVSEIARKGAIIAAKGESDLYDIQHEEDGFDEY